jgi:hypothetical protein
VGSGGEKVEAEVKLPEGWVAVFRWDEQAKCVQHVTRPNRTVCGGRRLGRTYHDAGIGWLDAESSPEAADEIQRREWCGKCLEGMGAPRQVVDVRVPDGDRTVGDLGAAVGVREGGLVRDDGDGGVRP